MNKIQYQADLVNTNKLEEAQLTDLGAIVLELLRDPSGSSFQERLVAFAEANNIKMGGLKNISRSLVFFFVVLLETTLRQLKSQRIASRLGLQQKVLAFSRVHGKGKHLTTQRHR